MLQLDWFGEDRHRTPSKYVCVTGSGGKQDHRHSGERRVFELLPTKLEPIHPRHAHVEKHKGWKLAGHALKSVLTSSVS